MLVAWRRLLHPTCDIVGSVRDGGELLDIALRLKPDVILLDLAIANATWRLSRARPLERECCAEAAAFRGSEGRTRQAWS
jgi:DNA-binding NarL/FixJ family response regulator